MDHPDALEPARNASPAAPTVVVADGRARDREPMLGVLRDDGFAVVGVGADAAGAVALTRARRPDLALLAAELPGGGLRAAAEIAVCVPSTAVVLLATTPSERELDEALRVGVRGYLLRAHGTERLAAALRAALHGEMPLPRALVGRLVERLRLRDHPHDLSSLGHPGVRLTTREWDVLELLRQELGTAEIAQLLGIAPVTVRTHVAAILHKLGVETRHEAIRRLTPRVATATPAGGSGPRR